MLSVAITYRLADDAWDAPRRSCVIVAPTVPEVQTILRHVVPDAECCWVSSDFTEDTEISYQDTTTDCNRSEKRRKLRTKRQTAGRRR